MFKTSNIFPQVQRADFETLFAKAAKGKSINDLTYCTPEGLSISPLTQETTQTFLPQSESFEIGANIYANVLPSLKQAISLGAHQIRIFYPPSPFALEGNWSEQTFQKIAEEINKTTNTKIYLQAGIDHQIAKNLQQCSNNKNFYVLYDPFTPLLLNSQNNLILNTAQNNTITHIDGTWLANAGANHVLELTYILCCANHIEDHQTLAVTLSTNAHVLSSIAKIRSLKILWQKLFPQKILPLLHAQTSYHMLARKDIETNILRNTYAALAAIYGGANSVALHPHTLTQNTPDADALRLCITSLKVLKYEGYMGQTQDTLSGAPAIEDLTNQMVEATLALYHNIQDAGSIPSPQGQSLIKQKLKEGLQQKSNTKILGVNLHANENETASSSINLPYSSHWDSNFKPRRAEEFLQTNTGQA